jgi:AbrB family looped-hinge helix DNA binding protein
LVIPEQVREKLGVEPGDEIHFTIADGRVILSNGRSTVDRLQGFVGPIWRDYADEVRRDREDCVR